MDQVSVCQQPKYMKQEILLTFDFVKYKSIVELVDQKIKITLMMETLSPFKWQQEYSIEQLYKLNGVFIVCENLENSFESLQNFLNSKDLTIKLNDKAMIITIKLTQIFQRCQFDIILPQADINSSESFIQVNQMMTILEQKVNILESKNQEKEEEIVQLKKQLQLNKQELLQQINESQKEEKIQIEKKNRENEEEIVKLKKSDAEQQLHLEELLKQIKELKEEMLSQIMLKDEIPLIKDWIGVEQINFQLIYRATRDGFQIASLYEKCANKTPVIVFIKSTLYKRFGFYSDKEIKIYNSYLAQNPNKIFIFSLDTKKKFTSNEQNCATALYGHSSYLALGDGHDLIIHNNSNNNESSYNSPSSYGKNEGIDRFYVSGAANFKTLEIEVYQLQL